VGGSGSSGERHGVQEVEGRLDASVDFVGLAGLLKQSFWRYTELAKESRVE
jgi:hypothetical protein